MQRLSDDRGAVAVIVALLMVPLLGFAAISIDIAATHAEKQQLQTGADAAALAIAQDCSRDEFSCSTPQNTAQHFATANSHSDGTVAHARKTGQRVRVSNEAVREHWFAPVLGIDSTKVHASATAGWGFVSGGTSLPFIFSHCEFLKQTNDGTVSDTTKYQLRDSKNSNSDCQSKPTSGNFVPGGFGWITPDSGICGATARIGEEVKTDPGANVPNACKTELPKMLNQTIVLPLFENYRGNGNNGWYQVHGYFAFTMTGYSFPGNTSGLVSCDRCIEGYLTKYVDQSGDFEHSPTAPDLGASVVELLPDS